MLEDGNPDFSVVYRTIPTSNHNVIGYETREVQVVYRTIPTSNHNPALQHKDSCWLYIVLFLHQTTTLSLLRRNRRRLYIVLFLHQTTTLCIRYISRHELYIVLFLHQTTTHGKIAHSDAGCISYYSYIKPQQILTKPKLRYGCISYYSYIKPQPSTSSGRFILVVYRTIPTSNHNISRYHRC